MPLRIHSIETFGTHEGPGIRLVIFLQGCHFRCLYCHNPDTWSITGGKLLRNSQILQLLEQQKNYLSHGGLTISGGEPLLQRRSLINLFSAVKKQGIHTILDTNGSFLDDSTKKLLSLTDLVLLDVKHSNPSQHRVLTGHDNEQVLEFAKYLSAIHKPFWLRYVLVPGWTNQITALHDWARLFEHSPSLERVEILPFHTLGAYKYDALGLVNPLAQVLPPTAKEISVAEKIFKQYFPVVVVR